MAKPAKVQPHRLSLVNTHQMARPAHIW